MPLGYYGGVDEPYEPFAPPYTEGRPGDAFAMDADLTVYWPYMRPCWEEK